MKANPFIASGKWTGATPNETDEEKEERLRVLGEAERRSKEIDVDLQETKKLLEKRKKAVKILLLGQSESGKLAFAPNQFSNERVVWKTIIQLNVISSIKTILETLKEEFEPDTGAPRSSTDDYPQSQALRDLRRIRLGLGSGWKAMLNGSRRTSVEPAGRTILNHENDPTTVLAAQRGDIEELWTDPGVREVLRKRGVKLESSPGFFMNDIARIATPDYKPTDSDIIRARIRTVGVEEHHFIVEKGQDANSDFYITDVGGSRSQRATWVPYFDDVQAILFLAPLAFNQTLEEDSRVNRLEDSLSLWKDICSNKLLAAANLILFFNKKDVLIETLESGVLVRKYVPSYGDQPNEVTQVTKYFKDKFRSSHKKYSPTPRPFMCYETSAIDISSMAVLLVGVRESILRQHLREGDMI
ncbi:heterotrimeric GTP-binding alpha subunit [Cyathus striatus]|nr:heterotrimeric GTP-binding alpha subunit [Cyathus striatus]